MSETLIQPVTGMRRVLIVDDDRDLAETLASMLELESYAALPASSGEEALAELDAFAPDVALVDVRLGPESGIDLLQRLFARRPQLIAVVVTAYADTDTAVAALKYGAYDFIRKPVRPDILYSVLRRCYEKLSLERARQDAMAALRRAHAALAERERLYRLLADNVSDVIWTTDRELQFVYVSPSIQGLCGYTAEEFASASLIDRICDSSKQAGIAAYAMLEQNLLQGNLSSAPAVSAELELHHKSGATVWTETRASALFDEEGMPAGYLGVSRDITIRRKAEAEARQRQENLMRVERLVSLGTLVQGIGHEINNPNQVIMSAASALNIMWNDIAPLIEGMEAESPIAGLPREEACREIATLIDLQKNASERLKRIVHDLREFAQLDLENLSDSVEVNDAIERALRLVSSLVHKSTSNLETHFAENLPPVRGNRRRIEQVFINLIQNACQALPDAGRAIRIHSAYDPAESAVTVILHDEGTGIAAEHLAQLMDPFFTTRREQGGTGLGLSIANAIVKEHNGRLSIESRPGAGTRVRVSLPIAGTQE